MTLVCVMPFVGLKWQLIGGLEGDGGAYPECHIAQYPLNLGRKKVSGRRLCRFSKP
jgi:hypothetical protein